MLQTQAILALLLAVVLVEGDGMEKLLQLQRVMQLEPQIKKLVVKNVTKTLAQKRQVTGDPQDVALYKIPNDNQIIIQPKQQEGYHPEDATSQPRFYIYSPSGQSQYYTPNEEFFTPQYSNLQYYNDPNQSGDLQYFVPQQNGENHYQRDQYGIPVIVHIPHNFDSQYLQQLQYEPEEVKQFQEEKVEGYKNEHEEPQQKYVQVMYNYRPNGKQQLDKSFKYAPLEILVNNLVEPMQMMLQGSTKFGKQPIMPVYHYVPVPKGTFPDTKARDGFKDERIKETRPATTEAPDEPTVKEVVKGDYSTYDFGYRVTDNEKGVEMGKVETKMNGLTKGNYHVLLPDGRLQIVKYWSDHTGYHTEISYRSKS